MNAKPDSSRASPIKLSKPGRSRPCKILVGTLLLFLISTLLLVRHFDNRSNVSSETPKEEVSAVERTDSPGKDHANSEKHSTLDFSGEHPGPTDGGAQNASGIPESSPEGETPPVLDAKPAGFSRPGEEAIEWVLVPKGRFNSEIDGLPGEFTDVTLTYDYYISKKEVTVRQFRSLMPDIRLGSFIEDLPEDAPVTHLSWEDAAEFCARLLELKEEVPAGYVCRLPTEAEWEHACRMLDGANRSAEEQGALLSGMQENPGEWCLDVIKFDTTPVVDPLGRVEGPYHSLRGVRSESNCSARHVCLSDRGIQDVGFRPVLAPVVSRLAPIHRK